ncbi:MAG: hypothetical protein QOK15_72, partial [Nocardioidaceae bacterium]|nr:hypothetical protein [Nocardioidaceae bacterium]
RLVRELRPARDGRANPIFQVTLVLEPKAEPVDPDWSLHLMEVGIANAIGSAKFDLSLECDERPEGHISGRLNYDTDLFSPTTAQRLARHWHRLLVEILAHPTIPVSRLDLLDADERRQQLEEWNPAELDPVDTSTVHELVTNQARRAQDAVAVIQGDAQLTYGQLDQRADELARRLRDVGAGPGVIVGVCLGRSPALVVGLLGVLKSGAAYLPLDPRLPGDRLAFLMEDAGAGVLLTQPEVASLPPTVAPIVLLIDDCTVASVDRVEGVGHEEPWAGATQESAAYVMYTSGSTGMPKGVLVRHRNVVNYIRSLVDRPGLDHDDVALSVTTHAFDISVGDIFAPLIAGARVVIASSDEATDVRRLARLIGSSDATYLNVTPVTWQALVEAGWTGSRNLVAISGGDRLSERLARQLHARVGQLWTAYGPTETTVTATLTQLHDGEPVTLGRPIANARVYILDRYGALVPTGVTGEICIGGAGVAAGYLNRPEETEKRFQEDPFHPGETMYRSGDLGRHLPDGRLEYLGRADDQLKIRGFRIEPGEVEAALLGCEGVASAVVRADGVGTERSLVAYVVVRGSSPPTSADLRDALRRRLPDYMVPSVIVPLPSLPTTSSGKVDMRALPAPVRALPDETVGAQPTSVLEQDLARIWARVLGVERVDVDASFFDLGGHSLLAVRALLDVERELGVEVPLSALFRSGASVRGVATTIATTRGQDDLVGHPATPLFFVHPQPATVPSMRHFTGPLGADRPIEVLLPERPTGRFDLALSIPEMTRPLLQSVQAVQPSGPYLIAGYSLGGLLAYELATQLIAAGESVAWLGLVDTPFPGVLGRRPSQTQLFKLYASRGWLTLLRQCRSALRRELRSLRVRVRPDPHVFDYRGAEIIGSRYAPEAVDTHLAVFATDAMVTDQRFGPALGWDAVHPGPVEIHAMQGSHESVLLPPNVHVLAELLSASISGLAPA